MLLFPVGEVAFLFYIMRQTLVIPAEKHDVVKIKSGDAKLESIIPGARTQSELTSEEDFEL